MLEISLIPLRHERFKMLSRFRRVTQIQNKATIRIARFVTLPESNQKVHTRAVDQSSACHPKFATSTAAEPERCSTGLTIHTPRHYSPAAPSVSYKPPTGRFSRDEGRHTSMLASNPLETDLMQPAPVGIAGRAGNRT